MARKKGKRTATSGKAGGGRKARDSTTFLDRSFVGHGEVCLPFAGNPALARLAALRDAWEDAAGQALRHFVGDYRDLGCKAGCHKSWGIGVPRPANPTGKQIFAGFLKQFGLLLSGGLAVELVHTSQDRSGPDVTRYWATVSLRQSFILECTGDKADKPRPDPDTLLETTRAVFDLLEELATRLR